MSIDNIEDITPRVQYTASAAQTEFEYPFPIFAQEDLAVDVDGVIQTLASDYTVDGVGADTGGTVTFTSGLSGGEVVTVYRDTAIERTSDFGQNGPFSSSAHNDELDRITIVLQELRAQIGRAIRFPFSAKTTNAQALLSPLSNWLGKLIRISDAGVPEPVTVGDLDGELLTQSLIGETLFPRTDAESAEGVTPVRFDVRELTASRYGIDLTGTNDSRAALQAAIDVAEQTITDAFAILQGGAQVYIPRGRYKLSGPLTITKRGVQIVGDGRGTALFADSGFSANRALIESRDVSDRGDSKVTINFFLRDLSLFGADPATEDFTSTYTSSVRGVWATGIDGATGPCGFERVHFRGLGVGLCLAGCWRFVVDNCSFIGGASGNKTGTAISFGDNTLTGAEAYNSAYSVNDPSVTAPYIQFCSLAINWLNGAAGSITRPVIENNSNSTGVIVFSNVHRATLEDGYFEDNEGYAIRLGGSAGGNVAERIDLKGNYFAPRTAGTTGDIRLQNLDLCNIDGNDHNGGTGVDIVTASSDFACTKSYIEYNSITENTAIDRDSNLLRDLADDYLPKEFGVLENAADIATIAIKSRTAGSQSIALTLEEVSGAERWSIGVNSNGDMVFYNSSETTADIALSDDQPAIVFLREATAASAPNGSLFVDTSDDILKYKDSSGNVNALYSP